MESGCGEVKKQDGFGLKKTGKKWGKGWNLWGLIQRKADTTKNEVKTEQSLKLGGNAMEGSLAESLLKLRRVAKGESNGDVSEKLLRSYSVSARKSCDGMFHGASVVSGFEGGRSSCDGLFHGSITGGAETGRRSLCEDKQNHLLRRDDKLGASYSLDSPRNESRLVDDLCLVLLWVYICSVRCSASGGNGSAAKRTTLYDLYEKEGQSPWYDNLSHPVTDLLPFIARGVCGVTSNPAIFQKAISTSNAYNDQFRYSFTISWMHAFWQY
ncbi:hypothetical protein Bca4012_038928 [Brassica carinata]